MHNGDMKNLLPDTEPLLSVIIGQLLNIPR